MHKVFLVLGPESSGNHLASKVLQTMGCYWEEPQKLDLFLKKDGINIGSTITENKNLVLRRSVPYGKEWFDPISAREKFINRTKSHRTEYKMYTIVLQREYMSTVLSNYYHREYTIEDAKKKMIRAEKHISMYLSNGWLDPYWTLNVSLLLKDPEPAIKGLEIFTGLKWPEEIPYEDVVYDSDIKRHELIINHGFASIKRSVQKEYLMRGGKPKPAINRKKN